MEEPVSLSTEDEIVQSAQAPDAVAEPAALTVEQEVEMEPPAPTQVEMSAPVPDPALSDVRALKGILEALLFVTAEPIPVTRLLALLGAVTKQEVEQALTSLGQDYEQEGRGLQLAEVAGGYRIVTKAEFAPWLKRLEKVKAPSKLSRSALESLAIIAYKQPIVRAEVEQIRGVETSGVIRTLLERKLGFEDVDEESQSGDQQNDGHLLGEWTGLLTARNDRGHPGGSDEHRRARESRLGQIIGLFKSGVRKVALRLKPCGRKRYCTVEACKKKERFPVELCR